MQKDQQHLKEAKEELFLILAEFYKEPTKDFFAEINTGIIDQKVKGIFEVVEYNYSKIPTLKNSFSDYADMKKLYQNCFSGVTSPYAPAIESVYKVWTEDPTSEVINNSKGYLYGDAALHIKYLFEQFNLEIPVEYNKKPDHLTLLLEFLSFLITNRSGEEVKQYISDHFNWLEDFKEALTKVENSSFYVNVTDLVIQATQNEIKKLNKNLN